MKKILQVHEYFRRNLDTIIPNLPKDSDYKLLSFTGLGGGKYPIIGIFPRTGKFKTDPKHSDFFNYFDAAENYIAQVGLESLLERSKDLPTPKWSDLENGMMYPD
ncbi:MAG: hypothetical protein HYZ14_04025 [Bacteroidetes bacterium]|nr:hypothetical protein [Bacteroidota bacterium]